MRHGARLTPLALALAGLLSALAFLSCREAARNTSTEHVHEGRSESLVDPVALLNRLCDPAAVAGVSRVTLSGQLDPLGTAQRRPVEESARWPSSWTRRTADAGRAFELRLDEGVLRATPAGSGAGDAFGLSRARMRRRALFVLRHLASAVTAGRPPEIVERSGERLQALRARDADGEFLVLLGGLVGGLRGLEDGDDAVLFQAHASFGGWFYPATHSTLRNGSLLEVLRVTRLETE